MGSVCKDGEQSQLFSFVGGRLQSRLAKAPGSTGKCLSARAELPTDREPPQVLQVWAKPQPNNAVAVLVLSNGIVNGTVVHNGTIRLDFLGLGLPTAQNVSVRDIWALSDLGVHSGAFEIKAFSGHDSRFFLFSVANQTYTHIDDSSAGRLLI